MAYETLLVERKCKKKTWHKGVKQFKEERTYRPGLETYKWKE